MNLTIATFIPKPHTPFQWCAQLGLEASESHMKSIKRSLNNKIPGIKVSYHEASVSYVEGIISRGNADTAELIEKAYNKGCRLDAWEDYFNFDKWQEAIKEMDNNPENNINQEFPLDYEFPWNNIDLIVKKEFLKNEFIKAKNQQLTDSCKYNCDHNCGVCGDEGKLIQPFKEDTLSNFISEHNIEKTNIPVYSKFILTYKKEGKATYISHISTMRNFEMAFQRAKIDIHFTEGFNPKPKMEFLNPLSLGVTGEAELLLVEIDISKEPIETQIKRLNNKFCEGYYITGYKLDTMKKKTSLAARMNYSIFQISNIRDPEITKCLEEFSSVDRFKITKKEDCFLIKIIGEKNLFKTLFPDLNKFYVAENSYIVRKEISIKED